MLDLLIFIFFNRNLFAQSCTIENYQYKNCLFDSTNFTSGPNGDAGVISYCNFSGVANRQLCGSSRDCTIEYSNFYNLSRDHAVVGGDMSGRKVTLSFLFFLFNIYLPTIITTLRKQCICVYKNAGDFGTSSSE
jgi:hypothetical protein